MQTKLIGILFFLITSISNCLAQANHNFVVMELFTSQGCSSCPPADRLLQEYSKLAKNSGKPIHTISYHVDYWNYLGWKDPYSTKVASERQRKYAKALRRRGVYTPQLIINGKLNVVGSDRLNIEKYVNAELSKPQTARIKLKRITPEKFTHTSFSVNYEVPQGDYQLFIAITEDQDPNSVRSGENRGATLSHTNVVRKMEIYELDKPSPLKLELNIPTGIDPNQSTILALIQKKSSMEIVAATSMALNSR